MDDVSPAAMLDEDRLGRRVLPLLAEIDGLPRVFGSGVLLAVAGTLQLLTARHVIEQVHALTGALARLRVPTRPDRRELAALPLRACHAGEDITDALDADCCALRIEPQAAVPLQRHWQALRPDELASDEAPDEAAQYLIGGYPAARARPEREPPLAALYRVQTRRLAQSPNQASGPVHPRHDLFFSYAREGIDCASGQRQRTPPLEGLSGAPVWRCADGRPARMVGLQTSYCEGAWIRAKDARLIGRLLQLPLR